MNGQPKPIRGFEDLDVYQKAYKVSLLIHKVYELLPEQEKYSLGDQMRRASRSICANIAEGFAKQQRSAAEYKRFLLMAIGSSDEMRVWVQYCRDFSYITEDQWNYLHHQYKDISRMLQGIYGKWGPPSQR